MEIAELAYALDTFYFLVCGALVMWMAAGFTMLEAGLVRAKNTAEILTKNVGLYSIACIMYMLVGYNLMYPGDSWMITDWLGNFAMLGKDDNEAAAVIAGPFAGQVPPGIARRQDARQTEQNHSGLHRPPRLR